MTQHQILLNRFPSQVEVTVFHPQIVSAIGVIFDGERRRFTRVEDFQFSGVDFNITRAHLSILGLTNEHFTGHLDNEFSSQFSGL